MCLLVLGVDADWFVAVAEHHQVGAREAPLHAVLSAAAGARVMEHGQFYTFDGEHKLVRKCFEPSGAKVVHLRDVVVSEHGMQPGSRRQCVQKFVAHHVAGVKDGVSAACRIPDLVGQVVQLPRDEVSV